MGGHLSFVLITGLLLVGLYAAVARRSVSRVAAGLAVAFFALNLFLAAVGYSARGASGAAAGPGLPPAETAGLPAAEALGMCDPVPQAMGLTVTLLALAVLALVAAIGLRLSARDGGDLGEIKRLKG